MRSLEPGITEQNASVERPWHALYTRHQHEKSVTQLLANKGFEVYLPLVCTTHQWRDRKKQLWLPLFPCYVFIRSGSCGQLAFLNAPGLVNVVGWAGHPAMIPQRQIDAVRQMVESPLRVEPCAFLQCGDRVRVEAGPLRGVEGLLVHKKNTFRLVVSVEMLGRSAAVEIDFANVRRISTVRVATTPHPLPVSA